MSAQKYRLVTRSDFDGLVCAVLLNELDLIDVAVTVATIGRGVSARREDRRERRQRDARRARPAQEVPPAESRGRASLLRMP